MLLKIKGAIKMAKVVINRIFWNDSPISWNQSEKTWDQD